MYNIGRELIMENMPEKVGRIYRMKIPIFSGPSNLPETIDFYDRVVKILRLEGEFVIYTTLAVSRSDVIADHFNRNGYKFHKTFKPLQLATEITTKELPLFISWPITTPDFFRVLKGEI